MLDTSGADVYGEPLMSELLTTGEVANYLRISTKTVYRWVEDGTLKAVRIGSGLRYRKVDVEALASPTAADREG